MTLESFNFQTNTFDNPTSSIINSTTFDNQSSVVVDSTVFSNPESVITDTFTYHQTALIKLVSTVHPVPARATTGAAGHDIRANGTYVIPAGETAIISTGIYLDILPGMFGMLVSRSGLATKYGVTLVNGIGIIDSDFHGEVLVAIINNGQDYFTINHGDRVAQLLFLTVAAPNLVQVSDISTPTNRDPSGFGSTGV
jgi:dUTP pyrophosphatase